MDSRTGAPCWLALDGAVNGRVVVPGALLRADNLQGLSDRDVHRLVADEALELILDLRTDVEVELEGPGPLTAEPAVRIEHLSLLPDLSRDSGDAVNPWRHVHDDRWAEESAIVRAYMSYLEHRPDSIVAAMRGIAHADGAVLVHCAAGKDRTGVVVALALDAAGADRRAIIADYLASGERIEAILARLVRSETYRLELEGTKATQHAPVPGTIERVLELIDRSFGGSAAWLAAHGLAATDMHRLRERLAAARNVPALQD